MPNVAGLTNKKWKWHECLVLPKEELPTGMKIQRSSGLVELRGRLQALACEGTLVLVIKQFRSKQKRTLVLETNDSFRRKRVMMISKRSNLK